MKRKSLTCSKVKSSRMKQQNLQKGCPDGEAPFDDTSPMPLKPSPAETHS